MSRRPNKDPNPNNAAQEAEARKRNLDKRREASRYAARERRNHELEVYTNLTNVTPLVVETSASTADRISLLRVAATCCRLRSTAGNVLECAEPGETSLHDLHIWTEQMVTECFDGFIIMVNSDFTILYVTESVSIYLGLNQTELVGEHMAEFVHNEDMREFSQLTAEMTIREYDDLVTRTIVLRMKTTISPRGRTLNLRNALFKPVSFIIRSRKCISTGRILVMQGSCDPAGQGTVNTTANALNKSAANDSPSGMYMTRHGCDMRITYATERLSYILKNDMKSLIGASFYDVIHPQDAESIGKAMRELMAKGHVRTPYYRLLTSNGGIAWVMTEATTVSHTSKGTKGLYVVCIHSILGMQEDDESLVVCSDVVPAGRPVYVKREVEDIADEYVGRQPAVIESDNYVPLFADNNFILEETMRGGEDQTTTGRKDSFSEVFDWLFRDGPDSTQSVEQLGGVCGGRASVLAAQRVLGEVVGSPEQAGWQGLAVQPRGGAGCSSGPAPVGYSHGPSAPATQMQLAIGRSGPIPDRQTAHPARHIPAAIPFDSDAVSFELGRCVPEGQHSRVFSAMPAAHSARCAVSQPNEAHELHELSRGAGPLQSGNQGLGAELRAPMNSIYNVQAKPIVENLQWEEPILNLTSIAPYVPDDDIQTMDDDQMPSDLQLLLNNIPDWSVAEPLVPAARPGAMNQMKSAQYDCYQPAANNQNIAPIPIPMQQQQQQADPMFCSAQYWQPQNQWDYPARR